MAESLYQYEGDVVDWTADAAYVQGDIVQLNDGRAGQVMSDVSSGALVGVRVCGVLTSVTKTASQVWIKGAPIWWDHSANAATCVEPIGSSDRDFYIGTATADALSAATTGGVNLNRTPSYIIDSSRDNGKTVIVKTVVGSTTLEVPQVYNRGGMLFMQFGTTAEAQKVDWLSDRGFAVGSNFVAEFLVELVTAADNAAVDINFGVASGTHATDFETIAEFCAFQMNGANLNINAHSDDGTTDVTITDTTLDWAAGTPVNLTLDGRDSTNVKYYVNGVEVLAATSNLGKLTAASGPFYAIIHAEKTSDDSPLGMRARVRVRTAQAD